MRAVTTLWIAEDVELQVMEEFFSARVAVGMRGVPDPVTGMIVNLKDLKPWARGCLGVFVHRFRNLQEVASAWVQALQKNFPLLDVELLREFELAGAQVETAQHRLIWTPRDGFEVLQRGSVQIPTWEHRVWNWESSDRRFEMRNLMSQTAYSLKQTKQGGH